MSRNLRAVIIVSIVAGAATNDDFMPNLARGTHMSTELSPDKERLLEKLVADGRYTDRQQALDRAVDLLCEEADTVAEIREGLASIARGEGVPLDEAIRGLRNKFGVAFC